jgi:hypothetical protein
MTTTPDFRALCAELVKRLDELNYNFDIPSQSALIEYALDALATPPPEPVAGGYQTIARHAIESCLAQREEVLAAFIAKHGFHPEDIIQVEQRQPDGTLTWRIERRAALERWGK